MGFVFKKKPSKAEVVMEAVPDDVEPIAPKKKVKERPAHPVVMFEELEPDRLYFLRIGGVTYFGCKPRAIWGREILSLNRDIYDYGAARNFNPYEMPEGGYTHFIKMPDGCFVAFRYAETPEVKTANQLEFRFLKRRPAAIRSKFVFKKFIRLGRFLFKRRFKRLARPKKFRFIKRIPTKAKVFKFRIQR